MGDGTMATDLVETIQHPTSTYTKAGTCTVILTAKNAQGSSKLTNKNCFKVLVSKARQKSYILLS